MRDYIELGTTPCDEDCAQVGDPSYATSVREECRRFIALLRKQFGNEPESASLGIKGFPHNFGRYYEVVCYYESEVGAKYALELEHEAPTRWQN